MITIARKTFYALLLFNLIQSLAVINLYMFANQGRRYTAANGDADRAENLIRDTRERTERIDADVIERDERRQADRDITLRIDNLHPHAWPAPDTQDQ